MCGCVHLLEVQSNWTLFFFFRLDPRGTYSDSNATSFCGSSVLQYVYFTVDNSGD